MTFLQLHELCKKTSTLELKVKCGSGQFKKHAVKGAQFNRTNNFSPDLLYLMMIFYSQAAEWAEEVDQTVLFQHLESGLLITF